MFLTCSMVLQMLPILAPHSEQQHGGDIEFLLAFQRRTKPGQEERKSRSKTGEPNLWAMRGWRALFRAKDGQADGARQTSEAVAPPKSDNRTSQRHAV